MSEYEIIEGYQHRTEYCHFDDTANEDEWQAEVYELAYQVAINNGYNKIADVGCGSGFKLLKHFSEMDFTGYEIEPTLSKLKAKYPEGSWQESNFDTTPETAELVICSDVIEHVLDPDELVEYLLRFDAKHYVISTPDRDLVYGVGHMGPPRNPTHIREWNLPEFAKYLEQSFKILDISISNEEQFTQTALLTKK